MVTGRERIRGGEGCKKKIFQGWKIKERVVNPDGEVGKKAGKEGRAVEQLDFCGLPYWRKRKKKKPFNIKRTKGIWKKNCTQVFQ